VLIVSEACPCSSPQSCVFFLSSSGRICSLDFLFSSLVSTFMHLLLFISVFLALAGRGLGLNIVLGGQVGNVTASQFLIVPAQLQGDCQSICDPANSAIRGCNNNDTCLCLNDTVVPIRNCEQCLFTSLIRRNEKMPDPRVGSSPALTAYSAACLASVEVAIPVADITLTLPSNWDGPVSLVLPGGLTGVVVAVGAMVGLCGIYIVSSM